MSEPAQPGDDFLLWDDMDLDTILGEYTDEELLEPNVSSEFENRELDSSSESSANEEQAVTPAATSLVYECPTCRKQLKTPAGFRGHMLKQHTGFAQMDLKVLSVYRKEQAVVEKSKDSLKTRPSVPEPICSIDQFVEIYKEAIQRAFSSIEKDDVFQKSLTPTAVGVTQVIARLQTLSLQTSCPNLYQKMKELFNRHSVLIPKERMLLHKGFHVIRCDVGMCTEFLTAIKTFGVSDSDCSEQLANIVFQVTITKLFQAIIALLHAFQGSQDKQVVVNALSECDQKVLFYVSGYLARKTQDFCQKKPVLRQFKELCASFASQASNPEIEKFLTDWTELQTRGGLLFPSPAFFLLVKEIDMTYRQKIDRACLVVGNFDKAILLKTILSSPSVVLCWSKLLGQEVIDEAKVNKIFHYIVQLFVTIRGFAMAKKLASQNSQERRKESKDKKFVKTSKSLRGGLKK